LLPYMQRTFANYVGNAIPYNLILFYGHIYIGG